MISQFILGFRSPFQGLQLLVKEPTLRKWAVIPFLIDVTLFVIGLSLGWTYWPEFIGQYISDGDGFWKSIVYYVALVLGFFIYIILLSFVVFLAANIVSAPFNSLLTEKVLILKGFHQSRKLSVGQWFLLTLKMMSTSILNLVLFSLIGFLMFIGSFIPMLQILVGFVGLLLVAFDCAEYPYEIMGVGFRHRLGRYMTNVPAFSGFGCAVGLTMLLPGLNFLLYPAAVTGAALLVGHLNKDTRI